MRLVLLVLTATYMLAATDPQSKKKTEAPPAKLIKPLTVPPGAVEREPGHFYYTDSAGKKWIYIKTPFGIARVEDAPPAANAPKPVDEFANIKIIEEGDVVKFERPSPFGTYKWQKKKSELDEKEKAALAKSQDTSAKQDK
jgi:hypothetical protein